jgi:hypothetical protein
MPWFRRVAGNQAGPNALGILLPPGRRTLVVVRPRALDWDLLPLNPNENGGPRFWEVGRVEGPDLAQRLFRALEEAARAGSGRVEPVADDGGYELRAGFGLFVLVACSRRPGEAYQPYLFETLDLALEAAERLQQCLCPARDSEQEVYFNTRNFATQ